MANSEAIRKMFASITKRYDILNRLLSFGFDKGWREKTAGIALAEGHRVLDICAGTLDLSVTLKKMNNRAFVVGTDFCIDMLAEGKKKISSEKNMQQIDIICADSVRLPFKDASFDAVTAAFGIRNIKPPENAIKEMNRVLKTEGRAVILEFYKPEGLLLSCLFVPYLRLILPVIGSLVSGNRYAYSYLRDSVVGFVRRDEMSSILANAGFTGVEFIDLSMGVATIHIGRKKK